jgi:hypothetical protein
MQFWILGKTRILTHLELFYINVSAAMFGVGPLIEASPTPVQIYTTVEHSILTYSGTDIHYSRSQHHRTNSSYFRIYQAF